MLFASFWVDGEGKEGNLRWENNQKGHRNKASLRFILFIESTAKGALEMMGECNLTLIPFDDPTKKILEEVIEHGYNGSDVTKVKGNYNCTKIDGFTLFGEQK